MEERSVGVTSIELSRKILIIFLFLGFAYSLPTREERRQTLWRANKVRDTRVDDVIKDIKALVETEYLTLMERGETKNNNNNNNNNNNKDIKQLVETEYLTLMERGETQPKLEERLGEVVDAEEQLLESKNEIEETESIIGTKTSTIKLTPSSSTTVPKTTTKSTPTISTEKNAVKTTTTTTTLATTTATTTTNTPSPELRDGEELCDTIPDLGLLRNGLGQTGFLWPEGKIPYVISGDFSENQTNTIKESIKYYNDEFEGCIKWVERSGETNYVTFDNSGSCSSRIGVAFFPFPIAQSIQLGRCAHLAGHVKHEMMHTIGFYHEHSRSDRDKFVEVIKETKKN